MPKNKRHVTLLQASVVLILQKHS